jgi:hypothetical protein
MDDPKIRLYLDSKSGSAPAWNWELLLQGKKIAGGKSPGTQETAFTAALEALGKERERGPNVLRRNPTASGLWAMLNRTYCTQLFNPSAVDLRSSDRSAVTPSSECVSVVLASELGG